MPRPGWWTGAWRRSSSPAALPEAWLGARAGRRLAQRRGLLTKVFAGLILLVAAYMLARSLGLLR